MNQNKFLLILCIAIAYSVIIADANENITSTDTINILASGSNTVNTESAGTSGTLCSGGGACIAKIYGQPYIYSYYYNFSTGSRIKSVTQSGIGALAVGILKVPGSVYVYDNITISTSPEVPLINDVAMTAYVDGQYFGAGSIGWDYNGFGKVKFHFTFNVRNDTYADSLTGFHHIFFSYNRNQFSNWMNTVSAQQICDGGLDCRYLKSGYSTAQGFNFELQVNGNTAPAPGTIYDAAIHVNTDSMNDIISFDTLINNQYILTYNNVTGGYNFSETTSTNTQRNTTLHYLPVGEPYADPGVTIVSPLFFNSSTKNIYNYSIFYTNTSNNLILKLYFPIANSYYFYKIISGTELPTPTPTPAATPPQSNTATNSIFTTKSVYNSSEMVDVYGSFFPATTTETSCLFFNWFCTDTTINTESNTGYLFISTQGSTSPIKFISFTPDLANNYDVKFISDIGTYQVQLFGFAAPGSVCTSGIVYDYPFIPLGCYYPHNITSFTVTTTTPGLYIHWNTKISNSSAYYGETITVSWQNTSSSDIISIYDNNGLLVQSLNTSMISNNQAQVFLNLYSVGVWNATISNATTHYSAYLNVLPPGAVEVNNSYGVNMYWGKAVDVINNPTLLYWNTGSYFGGYSIAILNAKYETLTTKNFSAVPGQNQQASYVFDTPGSYTAEFLDINGSVQQQADIRITTPTTTQTPAAGGAETSINFIGSGSYMAIITEVFFMGVGGAAGGLVGMIAGIFVSIPIMYIGNLIPLWIVFLEAGIVFLCIAIFAAFQLVKTR